MIEKGKRDPRIRHLTALIIGDGRDKNFEREIRSIYEWIKSRIKYIPDIYGVDTFQEPITTLKMQGGDCDDLVILAASMLESIGYKTQLVVLFKNKIPFHIYLRAGIPTSIQNPLKWIDIELTEHSIGFGQNWKEMYSL